MTSPIRSCIKCFVDKPIDDFYRKRKGEETRETICKSCVLVKTKERHNRLYGSDSEYRRSYLDAVNERTRLARQSPQSRAGFVIQDSRKSDRKQGREFDLDKDFVSSLISKPCHYCGDTSCLMTLDRIDNNIGHVRTNVVQACSRCNDTRGRMPYDAWLVVSEGMKKALELGLFGTWAGDFAKRRT